MPAPLTLNLSQAEACTAANSSAHFHPTDRPQDEDPPCIDIAGILVLAYPDADRETVQVCVHLDTTDKQFVRADGTVPTYDWRSEVSGVRALCH